MSTYYIIHIHHNQTTFNTCTDVYLSLKGEIIPNYGYVNISDIGSTDETALLCHTNLPSPPGGENSGGNWFTPERKEVTTNNGFITGKGSMVVRLKRNLPTDPMEGIYYCIIEDKSSTSQVVYVGLYSSGRGINNLLKIML